MRRWRELSAALAFTSLAACADPPTSPKARPVPSPQADVFATPTIVVANLDDAGAGSLRQAIADAVAGDVIAFEESLAGGTIMLTSGALVVAKHITVEGSPSEGITISGHHSSRVLEISDPGDLTLVNTTITDGRADFGGGISNGSSLSIFNSTITANEATFGGGIYSEGVLMITNSTISGNMFDPASGGGLVLQDGSRTVLENVTITDNGANAVLGIGYPELTLRNSVLAGNSTANCSVVPDHIVLEGVNVSDDATCGAAGSHMIIADPHLASLADNGGPTMTHALSVGSSAIEAVPLIDCRVSEDQRHVARPQGPACDAGAYEFDAYFTIGLGVDASVVVNSKTGVALVSGTYSCSGVITSTLHVELSEPQKAGKVNTAVFASGDMPLYCQGPGAWAIALTPSTGAFKNGSGTVTASSPGVTGIVLSETASAPVKLFWGHKP